MMKKLLILFFVISAFTAKGQNFLTDPMVSSYLGNSAGKVSWSAFGFNFPGSYSVPSISRVNSSCWLSSYGFNSGSPFFNYSFLSGKATLTRQQSYLSGQPNFYSFVSSNLDFNHGITLSFLSPNRKNSLFLRFNHAFSDNVKDRNKDRLLDNANQNDYNGLVYYKLNHDKFRLDASYMHQEEHTLNGMRNEDSLSVNPSTFNLYRVERNSKLDAAVINISAIHFLRHRLDAEFQYQNYSEESKIGGHNYRPEQELYTGIIRFGQYYSRKNQFDFMLEGRLNRTRDDFDSVFNANRNNSVSFSGQYQRSFRRFSVKTNYRMDYFQDYKFKHQPTFQIAYHFTEHLVVSGDVIKGMQFVNPLLHNTFLFTGNQLVNWNANYTPDEFLKSGGALKWNATERLSIYASLFYYKYTARTIADAYSHAGTINFISSNTSQDLILDTKISWMPVKRLNFQFLYRMEKATADFSGVRKQLVLLPMHNFMSEISYQIRTRHENNKPILTIIVNTTVNAGFQLPVESDLAFRGGNSTLGINPRIEYNAGFKNDYYRKFKNRIRVYAGIENLTGYHQADAIQSNTNWAGLMQYGTLSPRRYYAGFSIYLGKLNEY